MTEDLEKDHDVYSKVTRRMWSDADFRALTAAPPNGQTLWLRLLTGLELTNIPGLFPAWDAGLARALRWSLEGFREAWSEIASKGMAEADWEEGIVWIPNAIEHNRPANPNVVKSWRRAWRALPECELKRRAFFELKSFLGAIGQKWVEAFLESCAEPFAERYPKEITGASSNQEQEQDQQQEQPGDTRAKALDVVDDPPNHEPAASPPAAAAKRRNLYLESLEPPNPQDVAVLDLWKARFSKSGVTFDARRMQCLGDRRLEGMTLQDAGDAIEGAAVDDWCATTTFKLTVIFADRERFEAYRDVGRGIREGRPPPTKARPRGEEPRQPNTGAYSAITHATRIR